MMFLRMDVGNWHLFNSRWLIAARSEKMGKRNIRSSREQNFGLMGSGAVMRGFGGPWGASP